MRRYNNVDTLERKSVERRMVAAGGRGCWYIQAIRKGWWFGFTVLFTIFVCLFAEEPLSWRSVA